MNNDDLLSKLIVGLQREYWFNETPPFAATSWLRHGGLCVYCSRPLMVDAETLRLSNCDHLLPLCKYRELGEVSLNCVPACRYCNQLKGKWDPNEEGKVCDQSATSLTIEAQQILIERAKQYLQRRRDEENRKFSAMIAKWKTAIAAYQGCLGL